MLRRAFTTAMAAPVASPAVCAALLSEDGVLRAGINMSNFLLVSARGPDGVSPAGVAPDIAHALGDALGASSVSLVPYANPGLLADAASRDEFDVGLVGAEPQRAEVGSRGPGGEGRDGSSLGSSCPMPRRPGSTSKSAREVVRAAPRIRV